MQFTWINHKDLGYYVRIDWGKNNAIEIAESFVRDVANGDCEYLSMKKETAIMLLNSLQNRRLIIEIIKDKLSD